MDKEYVQFRMKIKTRDKLRRLAAIKNKYMYDLLHELITNELEQSEKELFNNNLMKY